MPLSSTKRVGFGTVKAGSRGYFSSDVRHPVAARARRRLSSAATASRRAPARGRRRGARLLIACLPSGAGAAVAFRCVPTVRLVRLTKVRRHAPDVGLGHLVDAVDVAEQLAPVAVERLVGRELLGEALVASRARGAGRPSRAS